MEILSDKTAVKNYVSATHSNGKIVGLVPTMGALHPGHLSLLAQAKKTCDVVICSIFVNPTQFNDPKDLDKYPRPIANDILLLESAQCDVLFNPTAAEMYAEGETWHLQLGELEHLLEGRSRPGHYQGVTQIVFKLFDLIKPDVAFFGQKDYQQLMIIGKMVGLMNLPVKLTMCPIVREHDGLAMSSRNIHLSPVERMHALVLSQALMQVKQLFGVLSYTDLEKTAIEMMATEPGVITDYFTIADGDTLYPADPRSKKIVALVAAKVGNTRLIDNIILA